MSQKQTVQTLSPAARTAIARAYLQAASGFEQSGSLLSGVCSTAYSYFKGEPITEENRKIIVDEVCDKKGWKGKVRTNRASEVNVILKASHMLGDAITAFKKATGRMSWHEGMKLARELNKSGSVAKAVAKAKSTKPTNGDPVPPEGRFCAALLTLWNGKPKHRALVLQIVKILPDKGFNVSKKITGETK